MSYYISTRVKLGFANAIDAVERALAAEDFGIISRIEWTGLSPQRFQALFAYPERATADGIMRTMVDRSKAG